jgi:TonB-dependent SusC/RagA subfamily outer membrane receptor
MFGQIGSAHRNRNVVSFPIPQEKLHMLHSAVRWAASRARTIGVALGLVAATLAPAATVVAQSTGSIAGTVVNEKNGSPIGDAQIMVEGRNIGTTTDNAGRFRLAGLTGSGQVQITVRRIGFQPRTVGATIGDASVRIAMSERAMELTSVVVTGTAGVAEKRAIGNAVSTVNAAEVVATQPVNSFQELLNGRASGVSIVASSGQVGTGSRIRVRGASSLSLSNDPLIYVDGVRVDNTQASGPTNQAFGSASISRWNDFNPDDIESLEVIKGPAAATLYGTEASNGVIQIITKKGAAGRPVWNVTARGGSSWVPDWQTRFEDNYGTVPRAGSTTALDTVSISTKQLNDSLQRKFGNDIFTNGTLQDIQMSVSGGTSAVRYYVGGGYEENQGAERVNRLRRTNLRVNLQANPSPKLDLQSSLGYTTAAAEPPGPRSSRRPASCTVASMCRLATPIIRSWASGLVLPTPTTKRTMCFRMPTGSPVASSSPIVPRHG